MTTKETIDQHIADVFSRLNLPAAENGPMPPAPYFDFAGQQSGRPVEYRTILTNGTGRTLGLLDAQLE